MKTRRILIIFTTVTLIFMLSNCVKNRKSTGSETKAQTEVVADKTANDETVEPDSDSKGKGPLEVKSGIIEYTYSGDKTGKSTQFFDDYGMKSAVYAEITSHGQTSKGWSLTLGEDLYMWDQAKPGQGMKAKNPMAKMLMESEGKDLMSYMADMYKQMGLTESGTEMFQGKQCTVFKSDMGKVLVWKGIMMMMEMKMGDIVSRQEVTSVKTNVHVDGKYFRIPDNITFNEIPGF